MRLQVHPEYAVAVLLAIAVALFFPITRHVANRSDRLKYYQVQAIMVIGAVIGAKLAVVFGEFGWPFGRLGTDWASVVVSGRSILGALILGFLAAEAAKPLVGYTLPPNDRFAAVLPFSFAIGRVGCLLHGCCRGTPYNGWCAITYSDGVPRHPAQIYEMVFLLAIGALFLVMVKKHVLQGRLFSLYLVLYGMYRFCSEYVRETPKIFGTLSGYQLLSLVCIVLGAVALWYRSRGVAFRAVTEPAATAEAEFKSAPAGA